MPETSPGLSGNQSQPWCIGTIYVKELQMPKPPEKRIKNSQNDLTAIDMKIRLQPIMTPIEISLAQKTTMIRTGIENPNFEVVMNQDTRRFR